MRRAVPIGLVLALFACGGERGADGTPGSTSGPFTPGPLIGEAPFTLERNQIVLEVSMNGQGPFAVLLDTGGNPSGVGLEAARAADLPTDTVVPGRATGLGAGEGPVHTATIVGLEIGGAAMGAVAAVAVDHSGISERLGRPIDGVLGFSFFQNRIVQIDYPARTLRIFAVGPVTELPEEGAAVVLPLELRPQGTTPLIRDFHVNGRQVPVTLDTGSSLALELFPPAAERLGLGGTPGDPGPVQAPVDSIRIGSISLGAVTATLSPPPDSGPVPSSAAEEGNLGNGILQSLILTLDYANGLIVIERPAGA